MLRSMILCAIVALSMVSGETLAFSASVSAQEATPCPLWPQSDPGIVSWEVGQFMQWPSTILVQFAPGASRPADDGTTGAQVVTLTYIQTGIFTVVAETPMAVNRGGSEAGPELMPAGAEFTVEQGDFFVTGPAQPALRNDSEEPATYQSAVIYPADPTIVDPCQPLG